MSNATLQIGCQTFTWEMLGRDWTGSAVDLVRTIAKAGYAGIEITDTMIGDFADRPNAFKTLLEDEGIELISFAFGSSSGFCEVDQISADMEVTKKWIDFAAHFPSTLVSLGSATIMSEGNRDDKFAVAAEVYNRAAQLGALASITVAIHPSSHHNTLLLSRTDYDQIFSRLDENVGWVPDTGHILRGKMDMNDTLDTYKDRIRYIHLKDVSADGNWTMLGAGTCDTLAVIAAAQRAPNYNGWLVVEEESPFAVSNPNEAVRLNRETLRGLGY